MPAFPAPVKTIDSLTLGVAEVVIANGRVYDNFIETQEMPIQITLHEETADDFHIGTLTITKERVMLTCINPRMRTAMNEWFEDTASVEVNKSEIDILMYVDDMLQRTGFGDDSLVVTNYLYHPDLAQDHVDLNHLFTLVVDEPRFYLRDADKIESILRHMVTAFVYMQEYIWSHILNYKEQE